MRKLGGFQIKESMYHQVQLVMERDILISRVELLNLSIKQ